MSIIVQQQGRGMLIRGSYCPICYLRCVILIQVDFVVCPEHGQMSAMLQLSMVGMPKWEATIELRAEQYKQEIYQMYRRMLDHIERARVRDITTPDDICGMHSS